MKKVGVCTNCGRNCYTNDLDLCKRCYNLVGVEAAKEHEKEVGPEEEEEGPSMEELGLAPEKAEGEEKEEESKEEEKEEEKPAEEKKEEKPEEKKD
jgi:hypothetical protein